MKKSRRPRPSQSSGTQTSVTEEKKPSGNRGRPKKTVPVTTDNLYHDDAAKDNMADLDCSVNAAVDTQKPPEGKTRAAGRLSTALCRLCHGKFSLRSLRHAFNRRTRGAADIADDEPTSPLLFHTDFQRLVGVQLDRDPQLSEFICKKCHSKFYKCHSILIRFLQRVNLPPVGKENLKSWKKCPEASVNHVPITPHSFTSDPQCLHSLVSWAHHHGGACRSCPNLKEVLEGRGWGSVQAAWGCVDGHRYIMDTQCTPAAQPFSMNSCSGRDNGEGGVSWEEEQEEEDEGRSGNVRTASGSVSTLAQHSPAAVLSQSPADWTCNPEDFTGHDEALSPAVAPLEDRAPDSDLSDRVISEDDFEESRRGRLSDDEFEPDKRVSVPNKRRRSPKAQEEPKVRKKPGPKPGWKNKLKPKAEELPNIYKCPYQGCTAVYRAPDGLKKHIKEHHEEMKERPCPHPGCNKVFMIDRYLQRHVKLIHTEERNYICDQCGQTFKQRKHLSVHQMRHSGAKPLQCEVCGFQCRQRASLKYHMTKHKAEADLDFACLMCGKRFEKAHNLNVHMSMVHPLIQAKVQRGGSEQPPYSELHALALSGEGGHQEQDR